MPRLTAVANPRFRPGSTYRAPAPVTASLVAGDDPLSTTTTEEPAPRVRSASARAATGP